MPGMGGPNGSDGGPLVQAFHHALLVQGAFLLVVGAFLFVAWNQLRALQYRRAVSRGEPFPPPVPARPAEPPARRFLRIVFGLLWMADGLLQLQPGMPGGLAAAVLRPSAATSPAWVRHLVGAGADVWARHPAAAAASAVWIELGIGLLLLVAPRGLPSRAAGVVSVGWGLLVWSVGSAFGGIFAPGASVLIGAPGAGLLYAVAGGLVAAPEEAWTAPRTKRLLTAGTGVFLLAAAVLQAWPGRGSWQGRIGGRPGPLADMVTSMAAVPQPRPLAALLSGFARFDEAHGAAVNLVVVLALAAVGTGYLVGGRFLRPATGGLAALALADWVLVQDLGVWGGTATDVNSMVPLLLLGITATLATVRPAAASAPAAAPASAGAPGVAGTGEEVQPVGFAGAPGAPPGPDGGRAWWERIDAARAGRLAATAGALVVLLVGVAPMAAAAVDRTADPAVAIAAIGPPAAADSPAPGFSLVDQTGRTVSLASLRGHAVVLAFLDPVCNTDCPIIAQELRVASQLLGADTAQVRFVAILANRVHRSPASIDAFDRQEGLDAIPDWAFLTGSLPQLSAVWDAYGVTVVTPPKGAMSLHGDTVFVIDADGTLRWVLNADSGSDPAVRSSFAALLADQVRAVLHR